MFKNVAGQKIALFAFDVSTGLPKTGDAANITAYVNKDWAGVNALTDTSATEISSANSAGWYLFDLTQAESNADALLFSGKSLTANISVVGRPIDTIPANLSNLTASRAEPGQGAPPATTDLATKVDYLYKAARNKTEQTASQYKLYDDSGVTVDQKASVSDDGTTFTRSEIGAGP